MTLLLPWFPILLGTGVGGRLLGRKRGYALGLLAGLFWITLVQASVGSAVWKDPWTVTTLLAGALAIFTIGGWSGEAAQPDASSDEKNMVDHARDPQPRDESIRESLRHWTAALDRFDDWLAEHRHDSNPWPEFDDFLRSVLYECCRATHVKPYRKSSDGEELVPLLEPDTFTEVQRLSARKGIIGHVVTTGRSYVAGDKNQGELVSRLAAESSDATAWCFVVRQGTTRLGVITVGQIDLPPDDHRELLRGIERLVGQFWGLLSEVCRSRAAVLGDPISGLYVREAFLSAAEQSLKESYRQNEPVAAVVIALEGLRALNDSGRWEIADELVAEVSRELKRKVRMDDRVGRFDGSRFVLLLRRVDSGLATLIVNQMMDRLKRVCNDERRWHASIHVRCGLAGSGLDKPDLRTLLSRALMQAHRARTENVEMASDLQPEPSPSTGTFSTASASPDSTDASPCASPHRSPKPDGATPDAVSSAPADPSYPLLHSGRPAPSSAAPLGGVTET